MTGPVLDYVSKTGGRSECRRAGIVLVLWGSVLMPMGVLIGFVAARVALTEGDPVDYEPWWLWVFPTCGLPIGMLGIAFIFWGVSAMRFGVSLIKGRFRSLRTPLTLTTVCEILAYVGIAVFLLSFLNERDATGSNGWVYSLVFLLVYLSFPAALTLTRLALRSAERAMASQESVSARRDSLNAT